MSHFINPKLSLDTLDKYHMRSAIFRAICSSLGLFSGKLLDVGCGQMPYKGFIEKNSSIESYIGLDIESSLIYDANTKPDIQWDGKVMPFRDEVFDTAIATEVLEHCPNPEVVIGETYRVLKKNGIFFLTVPFLWPLHEVPFDQFRYTPFSMQRLLEEAGFGDIAITASGGWHAAMAQMIGLYVSRAPNSLWVKRILGIISLPVIKVLLYRDRRSKFSFLESQMLTGMSIVARKKVTVNHD